MTRLENKRRKRENNIFIRICSNLVGFVFLLAIVAGTLLDKENDYNSQNDKVSNYNYEQGDFLNDTDSEQYASVKTEDVSETPAETVFSDYDEVIFSAGDIPAYSGSDYVEVNHNVPGFDIDNLLNESFEYYSDLDSLGRCGVTYACVGTDIMPVEERGEIGPVKPSGWHTVKYDIVDGKYLYNRCHLIGYQLSGENANVNNLITGTRQMNVEGMLPFENMVADYVTETKNHVMYRVTPIYEGNNLLATGVLMEGYSVEDRGAGICFNVFVYNVQDGIKIDYSDGNSELLEETNLESLLVGNELGLMLDSELDTTEDLKLELEPEVAQGQAQKLEPEIPEVKGKYAVNGRNGKIHIVGDCSATGTGANAMKEPVYFETYDKAEMYSQNMFPEQNKIKCGNCW